MRRTLTLFVAAVLCLLAAPAAADTAWHKNSVSGGSVANLVPGRSVFFQETETGTEDSKVLDTTGCPSFTMQVLNSSGGVGTVFLRSPAEWPDDRVGVDADSVKILNDAGDLAMTGNVTNGLAWIYNIRNVPWVYVSVEVAPGASETITVRLTCGEV